ncbi:MAG: RHS repeat-associated core domain-containing protein, partial [Bacteroides sp.]|nr:RHS repeat-associated core domain-containing protein [Bacteroides sp.]
MRHKLFTGLLLAMSCLGMQAQDKTQNYVRVRTMLNAANTSYVDNINYYDGIGRPLQTVEMATKSGTQTGSILATLQEYDDAGRETNSWLPTPITGTYLAASSFKTRAQGTSGYSDANPYNQVNYEASPLNRVSSQYGAGAAWHTNSKAVKTEYLLNQASGVQACKYYYLSSNVLAGGSAYYAANTLKVTKVTDEDGKVSYSFVDKIGRKLLERQVVGTTYLDTYYIYDDLGNIRYVLQPMYQTEASLAKYAFQYEYDGYN